MGSGFYGALLLSGFLGSLGHCLGMCGTVVAVVGSQVRGRGLSSLPHHLLYHGARLAVYAGLGALAGMAGSLADLVESVSCLAGGLSVVLGLAVMLVGLEQFDASPLPHIRLPSGALGSAMSRVLKGGGAWGLALLGALTGVLPCGLVYGALLVAASTRGLLSGALSMACFGVGTLPVLLIAGLGAGALSARARLALARASGMLLLLMGVHLALRGLAELHAVPHLQLGRVMLW